MPPPPQQHTHTHTCCWRRRQEPWEIYLCCVFQKNNMYHTITIVFIRPNLALCMCAFSVTSDSATPWTVKTVKDREGLHAAAHGVSESQTQLSNWKTIITLYKLKNWHHVIFCIVHHKLHKNLWLYEGWLEEVWSITQCFNSQWRNRDPEVHCLRKRDSFSQELGMVLTSPPWVTILSLNGSLELEFSGNNSTHLELG